MNHSSSEKRLSKKSEGVAGTGTENVAAPGSLASVHNVYADAWIANKSDVKMWSTQYPTQAGTPAEDSFSLQHAIIARYKLSEDPSKTLDLHSVVVQSSLLKKSLGRVLEGYPGITTELERVEFTAPFECFVHRWERMQAEREALALQAKNANPTAAQMAADASAHLDVMYTTLKTELASVIREKNDFIVHGVTTFDKLWMLFEPGCLMYEKEYGHDCLFELKTMKTEHQSSGKKHKLECQSVDFDGTTFGYLKHNIYIKEFKGTKKIAKLETYPMRYYDGVEELERRLMERGAMFEAYRGCRFVAYDGIAMTKEHRGQNKFYVKSRIIVDAHSCSRYGDKPNLQPFETRQIVQESASSVNGEETDEDCVVLDEAAGTKKDAAPVGKKPTPNTEPPLLTAQQRLIATPFVRGYSLRDKKWCKFFIDSIRDITWDDDAFASLVAPQDQKDLVLAFAQSQIKSRDGFDDFIQGKGQGIIMLLAGPPGVGKTLTAESVAETMRAPLYSVGASDLGSKSYGYPSGRGVVRRANGLVLNVETDKPSLLENKLQDILEMCSKWHAVLLIDEADVFMESRSTADLERNKLVAIFLRLLEYFSGFMFLTTNRIEHMDAAFESRIHLTLNYTDLDKASRRHVWTTFLTSHARGKDSNVGVFTEAELDRLSKEKLNGRQIKNMIKTARLLACSHDECLGMGHLETVLRLRKANERKTVGFFGGGE